MASVNRVTLIGNLGADPEIRYSPQGQAVSNFRIACSESWTDKGGQKQERTEWARIVAWGKLAELAGEYLQKGRQVYVEGRLQTREWTDKEDRKQWTTEVVANEIVFLGSKPDASSGERRESAPAQSTRTDSASGITFPFGRNKGQSIVGASTADLEWSADRCRESIADPSKARWHDKERAFLAALESEMERQRGDGPAAQSQQSQGSGWGGTQPGNPYERGGYGAPTDDDIPFVF